MGKAKGPETGQVRVRKGAFSSQGHLVAGVYRGLPIPVDSSGVNCKRIGMIWRAGLLQVDFILSLLHQAISTGLNLTGRATFAGQNRGKWVTSTPRGAGLTTVVPKGCLLLRRPQ